MPINMSNAKKYAKDAVKTLKISEVNSFDALKDLSVANELDICRGAYTSWEVLELMIILDYLVQREMK